MENKKDIEKIYHGDKLVASIIRPLNSKKGLSFLTDSEDYIQVGVWNYPKNTILPAHYHKEFRRESFKTNESVYVVRGKIKCNLYFENGEFISSHILDEGEMIIQFNGAHEYFIEEDALVIENKNGPYFGPEKDRTRI